MRGRVWCAGVRSLLLAVRATVARSFRLFTKKGYERSEYPSNSESRGKFFFGAVSGTAGRSGSPLDPGHATSGPDISALCRSHGDGSRPSGGNSGAPSGLPWLLGHGWNFEPFQRLGVLGVGEELSSIAEKVAGHFDNASHLLVHSSAGCGADHDRDVLGRTLRADSHEAERLGGSVGQLPRVHLVGFEVVLA